MLLDIRRVIFDSWNVPHIARHEVAPEEVEQVCFSDDYIVRTTYKERFLLVGPTWSGRMLAVVLEPEPEQGHFYAVTARPASRQERRIYAREKGGYSL
jgi:uncharacterized DUF497 family protein